MGVAPTVWDGLAMLVKERSVNSVMGAAGYGFTTKRARMSRKDHPLPVLGRPRNGGVLPVLGQPSLDWPVHGFKSAGSAVHGDPLHVTGTFAGSNRKSHVPYVGQTTLPMFDHSLGSTFRMPELSALSQNPSTARVFAGSGLHWDKADPPPKSIDSSHLGHQIEVNDLPSPATHSGSWAINQRHWLGLDEPSEAWPKPRWNKEVCEGTPVLKSVEFNSANERRFREPRVYFAARPDVEIFTGETDLETWGKNLPFY